MLKISRNFEDCPPHPGEILREDVLPRLRLGPSSLAGHLGLAPETVAELLAERHPLTADIAQRLAGTFGHSLRFWLGLQAQYDCWQRDAAGAA